jgi:hypothetical protein
VSCRKVGGLQERPIEAGPQAVTVAVDFLCGIFISSRARLVQRLRSDDSSCVYLFDSHTGAALNRTPLYGTTYRQSTRGAGRAYARVPDSPFPEKAVMPLQAVRVCKLLIVMALLGSVAGAGLEAQVGISSGMRQVALVARAPSHLTLPSVSHRKIGRRGDLDEAAVSISVPAGGGYRVVARGNAGITSRIWIQVADDGYQELTPGAAVMLPGARHGSSEREVRYLTDGSASTADVPLRFELLIDPVI